jgi:hypothetical protein
VVNAPVTIDLVKDPAATLGDDVKKFLASLPPDVRKDLEAKADAYRLTLPGYAKVAGVPLKV